VLLDGTEVAVKIKYPRVTNFIDIDLKMHYLFTEVYKRVQPKFDFQPGVREHIYEQLRLELNFINEAQNMKRCKENLKNHPLIYIPYAVDRLVSTDVLTMEFIHGYKINNLKAIEEHSWKKDIIAKTILKALADQIFVHGDIHADPHPGNLFIRPLPGDSSQCQVVILDHGLYTHIDDAFRIAFARLWKAMICKDDETMKEICDSLNIKHYELFASLLLFQSYDGINIPSFAGTDAKKETNEDAAQANALSSLIERSHKDKTRWIEMMATMPPKIHFLFRSMFIARAVNVELGNRANRFEIMARSATSVLEQQTSANFEFQLFVISVKSYVVTKTVNFALWLRSLANYF